MRLLIQNSYCRFEGITPQVREMITAVLTYRNDIEAELARLFRQVEAAKKYGNLKKLHVILKQIDALKASEWVCWFRNDSFPTGHLNIVRAALQEIQAPCEEVDARERPENSLILKWYNQPFAPHYYQAEAINACLSEGRGVVEAAVGTGKSLMMAYIVKHLSTETVVVVPSTGLSLQIANSFRAWFGPTKVEEVTTARVRSGASLKPIRIITIQSVASLQESGDLGKLFDGVRTLLVDEIHHAGSKSYTDMLSEIDHVYYRFGFTGTFLRNDSKSLDMWGFLSNVVYRYPAHRAIAEGYLTPIRVLMHELPGKPKRDYKQEYDLNYCGAPQILSRVREICEATGPSEQVLVLVKNKDKAGKIIHDYLDAAGIPNTYVSGDNHKTEVVEAIRAFNERQVKILIGSSVIGEGIDVRSTDHLIMCQGGKSEIVVVQAVGRVVRLFPGKVLGVVHDFVFTNTKYMGKHADQRRDIYRRNFECPIDTVPLER